MPCRRNAAWRDPWARVGQNVPPPPPAYFATGTPPATPAPSYVTLGPTTSVYAPTNLATPGNPPAPAWYDAARSTIGDAMWTAVSAATCSATDVLYLDRLTEFLRDWANEVQKRANACRGPKKLT
jgi:hypothetical protein